MDTTSEFPTSFTTGMSDTSAIRRRFSASFADRDKQARFFVIPYLVQLLSLVGNIVGGPVQFPGRPAIRGDKLLWVIRFAGSFARNLVCGVEQPTGLPLVLHERGVSVIHSTKGTGSILGSFG